MTAYFTEDGSTEAVNARNRGRFVTGADGRYPFGHIRGATEWRSPFDFVMIPAAARTAGKVEKVAGLAR